MMDKGFVLQSILAETLVLLDTSQLMSTNDSNFVVLTALHLLQLI